MSFILISTLTHAVAFVLGYLYNEKIIRKLEKTGSFSDRYAANRIRKHKMHKRQELLDKFKLKSKQESVSESNPSTTQEE